MDSSKGKKVLGKKVVKYTFGALAIGTVVAVPVAMAMPHGEGLKQLNTQADYASQSDGALAAAQSSSTIQLSTTVTQKDFTFSGDNGVGKAAIDTQKTGLEHLFVYYSKDLASASNWTMTLPSGLTNGDVFYVRLSVQPNDASAYSIAPNVVPIAVSGLSIANVPNRLAANATLQASWFSFLGEEGKGSIYFAPEKGLSALSWPNLPGLDYRLEFQYSKGSTNVWTTNIFDLKNGDSVQVRLGVKSQYANAFSTYQGTTTLTVSGLLPATPNTQILNPNNVNYSGANGSGSIAYNGSYQYPVKFERTASFVSAFSDRGLSLDDPNNIYSFNNKSYRYLPTSLPVDSSSYFAAGAANVPDQYIRTSVPFILQSPKTLKHVVLSMSVFDNEKTPASPYTLTNYLSKIVSSNSHYINVDLYFNDDGTFNRATYIEAKPDGSNQDPAFAFTKAFDASSISKYDNGTLIDLGFRTGGWNVAVEGNVPLFSKPYNRTFLYIDANGNISMAMDVRDLDHNDAKQSDLYYNGMAVATTIKQVSYVSGPDWSTTINNDLVTGEYVSAYTSGTSATDPKSDFAARGFATQVDDLTKINYVASLNSSMFSFQKGPQNMLLSTDQATSDQLKLVDLLYSTDGISFSATLPNKLFMGDVVFVRQALKSASAVVSQYTLRPEDTIIALTVPDIGKIEISDSIQASDFSFSGFYGFGKAALISTKTLEPQVEVQYARTLKGNYFVDSPANLKNGDSLYAKLFLKDGVDTNRYEFANSDSAPLQLSVSGLHKLILPDRPYVNDFSFTGIAETGTIVRANLISTLSAQVEVLYSYTPQGPYTNVAPTNLKNNEVIYLSLGIKSGYENNYDLIDFVKKLDPLTPITVYGLTRKTLPDSLSINDLELSGIDGQGTVALDPDNHLTLGVDLVFATSLNGTYSKNVPTGLKNGDKIYAKLATNSILDEDNYELGAAALTPVELDVVDLGKTTLKDVISATDFTVSGTSESGTVTYRNASKLSSQVDVQYATSLNGPYYSAAPSNLKNGDSVYVKLVVARESNLYKLLPDAGDVITLPVNGLAKKALGDDFKANDFVFDGSALNGTVSYSAPLDAKLDMEYSLQQNGTYTHDFPTNLKNNDTFWVKVQLKSDPDPNYQLAPSVAQPTQVVVRGLDKIKVNAKIDQSAFLVNKNSTSDKVSVVVVTPPPAGLAYQFGLTSSNQPMSWSRVVPTNVSDQPIGVRLVALDSANYDVSSASSATINNSDKTTAPVATTASSNSLSLPAIIGIAVGAFAGGLLIASGAFLIFRLVRR